MVSNQTPTNLPEVTDDDIRWVSTLLGLNASVFYGTDGKDPRQKALKLMGTVDIAACPGSGKTTLLVAKLAILAKKWPFQTLGLCVLSHTNAAQDEIESKLGGTAIGRCLLSYPHYIGTIHGFVNKFLSLPLLRSSGLGDIHFSDDISGAKLWELSDNGAKIKSYLKNNFNNLRDHQTAIKSIHYLGEDLDLCLRTSNSSKVLKRSGNSPTFQLVNKWKKLILRQGFAAYDDILAYGQFALKRHSFLAGTLRDRFPLLFIDEAQDNSEEESAILHRIFIQGNSPVVRQRLGDDNQAIYRSINDKGVKNETYKFPAFNTKVIDLPNSNRFGQPIAMLADPLGLHRYVGGLIGQGPKKSELQTDPMECQHTIFLFNDGNADRVLDAYGELLLKTFPKDLAHREFKAVAVGQVHKHRDDDSEEKFPRHVRDYWNAYDPQITKPSTFVHYVLAGQEKATTNNLTHPAVEVIADAISQLVKTKSHGVRPQRHRQILERLKKLEQELDIQYTHPGISLSFEELVFRFAVKRETLTRAIWEDECRKTVTEIAEAIAGEKLSGQDVEKFLSWPFNLDESGNHQATGLSRNNIYVYPRDNPKVQIRLGSIHSVKGQTHTTTLVLETFWHDSNLESLLPWLCGQKLGCIPKTGVRARTRLKLHYVAMTRPTHLLCLAMKQSSVAKEYQQKLKDRGWNIISI